MIINPGDIVTHRGSHWVVKKELRPASRWDGKKWVKDRRFVITQGDREKRIFIHEIDSIDFRF